MKPGSPQEPDSDGEEVQPQDSDAEAPDFDPDEDKDMLDKWEQFEEQPVKLLLVLNDS